jgi:hypothetical protein
VLIAREAIVARDLAGVAPGARVRVLAQGVGDIDAAATEALLSGISFAPPAPVHLSAEEGDDGATAVSWIRRSRIGWRWVDGIDAPLGEESERYRVAITPEGGGERIVETVVPRIALSGAERVTGNKISVRQIGTHALSGPAELWLPPVGENA